MNIISNNIVAKMKLIFLQLMIIFSITFINYQAKDSGDEVILAKVGDKIITLRDFKLRSELTIRPKNFEDKETILNNLIIEKLMAIEAESDLKFIHNPKIISQLKGIKEQSMRDKLFESMSDKIEIDSNNLSQAYRLSSRAYQVEFYTIQSNQVANNIKEFINANPTEVDTVIKMLKDKIGRQPEHIIKFDDPESDIIHDALFNEFVEVNSVIGPLKYSKNKHIILKVLDWVDFPVIGFEAQMKRLDEVKKKIIKKRSNREWSAFQANLMKGKKVLFDTDVFNSMSKIAYENYKTSRGNDTLNLPLSNISFNEVDYKEGSKFFSVDNINWTIGDFRKSMDSHPLVFQSKELTNNNFRSEFKAAIIDLIKDHFITREAYKENLDKSDEIKKNINTWKDSFIAFQYGRDYLQKAEANGEFEKNNKSDKKKYWNKSIDKVISNHQENVWVNIDEFKKIKVTNINYFIFRPGVPYPVPVANFPTFTDTQQLKFTQTLNKNSRK